MSINAGSIYSSIPLQRLARTLASGGEYSTLDLNMLCHTTCASTRISELRANGIEVACRREQREQYGESRPVWLYRAADLSALRALLAEIDAAAQTSEAA